MTDTLPSRARRGAVHPGPPLAAPATLFTVAFVASVALPPIAGAGTMPPPYARADQVREFFTAAAPALGVASAVQLLAALALAVFTAVAWSRLTYLAPNAPGPAIAAAGGGMAAAMLALTAGVQWVAVQAPVLEQDGVVRMLHHLMFVLGGPVHTAALGVLTLGCAVTSWFVGRIPRRLSQAGIVVGALAVLSGVALVSDVLTPLVPIGRFTAMLWLLAFAVLTPRTRAQ